MEVPLILWFMFVNDRKKVLRILAAFLVAVTIAAPLTQSVHAQSAYEFSQLVQQFHSNTNDTALRERIITTARTVKPTPAIPEEARRHFVKGTTIAQSATDAAGQALAVRSFEEALKLAPWWGDAWYNLAVAQELAGQLDAAKTSLKLHILTGLNEEEARKAQDRIYTLEAKQDLANEPAAREERFFKSLDGAAFTKRELSPERPGCWGQTSYVVRSREIIILLGRGVRCPNQSNWSPFEGDEWRRFPLARVTTYESGVSQCDPQTVTISLDGLTMTSVGRCEGRPSTYVRAN